MNVMFLSLVLACRFFGLFVVMPLLPLYALGFEDTTPLYVGLAISVYALSQVIFQVPFGILSDSLGRKPLITLGIVIFIIGCIVCVLAETAFVLVIGRFLQGVGAIGGVVSAMVADSVIEEKRTKAMAMMGGAISLSFTLAMIVGSSAGVYLGIHFLFVLSAILSAISILFLWRVPAVPLSVPLVIGRDKQKEVYGSWRKNLQIMNLTNFFQKFLLTLTFVIIPTVMVQSFEYDVQDLWMIYVPAAVLGVLAMGPSAVMAEKKGRFKAVLYAGVVAFMLAYACILSQENTVFFVVGVFIFFIGFSVHEPIMQSLASKYCKVHQKGKALGIFTSYGYVGSFVGGLVGAHFFSYFSISSLALCVIGLCLMWICILKFLDPPTLLKNVYVPFDQIQFSLEDTQKLEQILTFQGVSECYLNEHEKKFVVRYNASMIDEKSILERL